jgi:hypothetical protein
MEENKVDPSNTDFKYTPDNDVPTTLSSSLEIDNIETDKNINFKWVELDTFSYSKKPSWYLILLIITTVLSAILFLLTKDKVTTGVIIVSGMLIGIYGAKKPKPTNYEIDKYGFQIGPRFYPFEKFKSFSLLVQGENITAMIVPLHRFKPYTYLNFRAEIQDNVLDNLFNTLPLETRRADIVDRTMRRIGF